MKKVIFTATIILISLTSFSQKDTVKSRDTDWGFALNVSGLINNVTLNTLSDVNNNNFILAKHHLKDDQVLRIGVGLKTINNNSFKSDSITISSGNRALRDIDSTEKRFDFSISLGFEKHLGATRRLDPYVGGELIVASIGKTKINADTKITDVTGGQTIQRIIQQDGGTTFGLNAVVGFNYFFAERISLGAEFGMGYLYSSTGGDVSESMVDTPVSGAQVASFIKSKSQSSTSGLNVNSTGGIMLSFFF